MQTWHFLLPSLLACFILVGIHAYLGIHVIERGVIFVDLALAQMAALGAIAASVAGITQPGAIYGCSLLSTFLGAALFSFIRSPERTIPQEAIIGIVYAVSAAFAVIIMSFSPEGTEHLKNMLTGNVLTVSWQQVIEMTLLYLAIGLLHYRFRAPVFASSRGTQASRLWDFFFYLTFGLVVTSSVAVAGVLLVFTFLIVPAVGAMLYYQRILPRLLFAWGMGFLSSALGLWLSYLLDWPPGATLVCTFALLLSLVSLYKMARCQQGSSQLV